MYLKNTSKTTSIVINTLVGKIGIKPQEVIDLQHKLLPPVSSSIKTVTKEDYLLFRQEKQLSEEPATATETTSIHEDTQSNTEMVKQDEVDETLNDVQNIVSDITKDLADNDIMGFVKDLLAKKPNFEEKGELPKTDPLIVTETDTEDKITYLKQQIEQLKVSWQEAKAPAKKGKISKQIKELQKQLDKLNAE